MKQLTETIHKHGCPTFMQINHDGPWQNPLFPGIGLLYDGPPVGASAVSLDAMGDFHNDVIRPLSVEEIEVIVDKTVEAALRARKAGFDGLNINAASSHLYHNFLSAFWNRRTDTYGGTQEKRAKFITEIVREIKKRVGSDFPISVCINSVEVGRTAGVDDSACLAHKSIRIEDLQSITDYFAAKFKRLMVTVRLNTEMDAAAVLSEYVEL